MYDRDALEAAGRGAISAFRSQEEWIHRRVETLTFPPTDDPTVRRHMSVDFTIPDLKPVRRKGLPGRRRPGRYYVPLSFLEKWPPVRRLDLRTGSGHPTPLLTAQQNGDIDSGLLIEMAEQIVGRRQLPQDIHESLDVLAREHDEERVEQALVSVIDLRIPVDQLDDARRRLREDPLFCHLAGALRDSTILWIRVQGEPDDREIAKFSYDVPIDIDLGKKYSLGYRAFPVEFKAPHIGTTGSYHLGIRAPVPLRVVDAELRVTRLRHDPYSQGPRQDIARCTAEREFARVGPITMYCNATEREARFYVSGDRTGSRGTTFVALLVEKSGLVRGASIAAMVITALLGAYLARLGEVVEFRSGAVGVLLVVPSLLAYLLVRQPESRVATGFLVALRRRLMLLGSLPLVGATALVVNGAQTSKALCIVWVVLVVAALILAFGLLPAGFLPIGDKRAPLSRADSEGPHFAAIDAFADAHGLQGSQTVQALAEEAQALAWSNYELESVGKVRQMYRFPEQP